MSNSYVAEYRDYIKRTKGKDDPRPDWQLTLELGDGLRASGDFATEEKYPDFRKEYLELKADNGRGFMGELSAGAGRAARGLGATALGAGALALDALGADETAKSLVAKGRDLEVGGDNAPAVSRVDDITGVGSAIKYASGKVGEAVPSLVESVGTGLIGAAVGTAAEPGGGTAVGGVAGMIGKQAIKNLLKKEVAKRVLKEAGEELTEVGVRNALAKGALAAESRNLLSTALAAEAKDVAKSWGANAAIAANSYALSSGEIYNETENPALALGAGAASAIPDTILPAHILSKFRGVANVEDAAKATGFWKAFAKELPKTIPLEAGTEAFQEAVNIAAERYNAGEDPMPTAKDISRLVEAGIGGAAGGLLGAPMAAYGESRTREEEPTAQPEQKPATMAASRPTQPVAEEESAPRLTKVDGARKAARLAQSDPTAAVARLEQLEQEGSLNIEQQGELETLQAAFPKAKPAPQSPAVVESVAPTSGGASPESLSIQERTESKLSVDGTQPSAATPSTDKESLPVAPVVKESLTTAPLIKAQKPEEKLAEVALLKKKQLARLSSIGKRFPGTIGEVTGLLNAHPAVPMDETAVREYAAKVDAIEANAIRAREGARDEAKARKEAEKADRAWDRRDTIDTWQTINATPNLDDAGKSQLDLMQLAVGRWQDRVAELGAKDALSVPEAQELSRLRKRVKRYALPEKLTPAPGNISAERTQNQTQPNNGLQEEAQGQVIAPAPAATPSEPVRLFAPVGEAAFLDNNEATKGLTPYEWATGLLSSGALKNAMGRTGNRNRSRVSMVFEGPNGEVIERGVYMPANDKPVDGKVAPTVQAISVLKGGKRQVVTNRTDGKKASPMLLEDLIAAGWKPIGRIMYGSLNAQKGEEGYVEPGFIANNYQNRAHFDASFGAAEKVSAQKTGEQGGNHVFSRGENAVLAAEASQSLAEAGKASGAQELAIDRGLIADLEAKLEAATTPEARAEAKANLIEAQAGLEESARAADGMVARTRGRGKFVTGDAVAATESELASMDGKSDAKRVKNLAAAVSDPKAEQEAVASKVEDVTKKAKALEAKVKKAIGAKRMKALLAEAAGKNISELRKLVDAEKTANPKLQKLHDETEGLSTNALENHVRRSVGSTSASGRERGGVSRRRGSARGVEGDRGTEGRRGVRAVGGEGDGVVDSGAPEGRTGNDNPADAGTGFAELKAALPLESSRATTLYSKLARLRLVDEQGELSRTTLAKLGSVTSDLLTDASVRYGDSVAFFRELQAAIDSSRNAGEFAAILKPVAKEGARPLPEGTIVRVGTMEIPGAVPRKIIRSIDINIPDANGERLSYTTAKAVEAGYKLPLILNNEEKIKDGEYVMQGKALMKSAAVLNAPPQTTAAGRKMEMGVTDGVDLLVYGSDMPMPAAARDALATLADRNASLLRDVNVVVTERAPIAPNGKPSKLNAHQWKQVRTPKFKAWFGDWENDPANASKVVDPETGEPLVVYHGTPAEFSEFSDAESVPRNMQKASDTTGYYFSSDPQIASSYAIHRTGTGRVMPVFLNIRNPKKHSGNGTTGRYMMAIVRKGEASEYLRDGVDGLVYDRVGAFPTPSEEAVAFSPNQIKSAIGNTGAFNSSDDNILHAPFREPTEFGDRESYDPATHTIRIFRDSPPARVLEELVHALTVAKWRAAVELYGADLTDAPLAFGELKTVFDAARQAFPQEQGMTPEQAFASNGITGYRLASMEEFIAGVLTDAEFQQALAKVPMGKQSLWQRVVNALRSLLGLDPRMNSLLDEALRTTGRFAAEPDPVSEALEAKRSYLNTAQEIVRAFTPTDAIPAGYLDPLTGKMRNPRVLPESRQAAVWNALFAPPTADRSTWGPVDDQNAVAALREYDGVLQAAWKKLARNGETLAQFFKVIGRGAKPGEEMVAIAQRRPEAQNAKLGSLGHDEGRATFDAYVLLRKAQHTAYRKAAINASMERNLSDKLVAQVKKAAEVDKRFRDAELMESHLRDKAKELVVELGRSIERGTSASFAGGRLDGAIREIEMLRPDEAIPESYQQVLKHVLDGEVRVFDYLQAMAKMGVEFGTLSAREVAKAVDDMATTSPVLEALSRNKPLKAALAALASSNSKEMDLLALRVSRNQAEYLETMRDLDSIRMASDAQLKEIAKTIPAYGEARSLRDRLKFEMVNARQEAAATQKRIQRAEEDAARAREAGALFGARATELEKIVGAYSDWQPVNGATYFVMQRKEDGTWRRAERTLELTADDIGEQTAKDIAANWRWLAETKDELGGTRAHNEVLRQTEAMQQSDLMRKMNAAHRFFLDRALQPIAEKFESTGTVEGKQIARRFRQFQFILKTHGDKTEALARKWDHAMQAAAKAAGYDHHRAFFEEVYDRVLYAIESEPGLVNDEAKVMRLAGRVAREHVRDATKLASDFDKKLAEVLRATKAISEHFLDVAGSRGLHVEDAHATDPLGRGHNLLRNAIKYGWLTSPRKLRNSTLQNVVNRMGGLGWRSGRGNRTFESDEGGALSLDEAARYFSPDVIEEFLAPFCTKPGAPVFSGAIGPNKKRVMVDQDIVRDLWQTSESVPEFVEKLFLASGGTQFGDTLEDFAANWLREVDGHYHMLATIVAQTSTVKDVFNPNGPRAHRLMDSRTNDLIPPEFFEYETFDPAAARAHLGEIAFHAAFGRDGGGLEADKHGLVQELRMKANQYRQLKNRFGKRERAAEAKRLGLDLRALERADRNLGNVQKWMAEVGIHFSGKNQSGALGDAKALLEFVNLNMMLVLNQPKSGLWNLMSMADFPILFRGVGKSSRSATRSAFKYLLKGTMGSALETFGVHMLHATENEKILMDLFDRQTSQLPWCVLLSDMGKGAEFDEGGIGNTVTVGARKISQALKKQVGGGEFLGGADTLWAPFRSINNKAAHALAVSNVEQVEAMVRRGMDWLERHPEAFDDPEFRFSAADLGMGGKGFFGDEGAYQFYRDRLSDYGLGSLEQIARDALGRKAASGRVLTRDQVMMVGMMALNEVSLESSINTRPIEMFNNPVLAIGMKLLGWPISKMNQVHKAMKGPNGEFSWNPLAKEGRHMLNALAVMALWALPVGIAGSLAMDEYDEKIVGKKSNLRAVNPLAAVPLLGPLAFVGEDGWSNMLAALERGARAGNVYGLGADFVNSLTNIVDPSSGQRDFTLDSRVLVFSQFANFRDMVRNFIHTDGTVTYASVGRPLLSSLGGNGVIQYTQIWNRMLGLDNAEARVTAKINAGNWLRAAGRETGLELRLGEGRTSPTPVSIQVRQMQLAAYAGDRLGFLEAYRAAVAAARKDLPVGTDPAEAEKKVIASWKSRHPLTSTFRGKPTEEQYFALLNAMNDEGRAAVQAAIGAYDQFTEMIAPKKQAGALSLPKMRDPLEARRRALGW